MSPVSSGESFLRAFHDASPGITSRAFGRAGSYQRLAARFASLVPHGLVLDLACGDGSLLALLGPRAIGIDVSAAELQAAQQTISCIRDIDASKQTISCIRDIDASKQTISCIRDIDASKQTISCIRDISAMARVVRARAQDLPFHDRAFEGVTCHLAFMLFDDIERVVDELARVQKPGAPFIALLGGGPTADGDDAFHAFARLVDTRAFGDKRASSEAGWRELFAGWRSAHDITFERWPLDLGGSFDEVWSFLSSSYQLRDHDRVREALRAAFPGERVPCTVATYCATVTR